MPGQTDQLAGLASNFDPKKHVSGAADSQSNS
jgi:hypothetical protein